MSETTVGRKTGRICPYCDGTLSDYDLGYINGLRAFAWWKDGVEFVGTCGMTLEQAIDKYLKNAIHAEPGSGDLV